MYGEGISKLGDLLDLAVKLDLVQKSGSWFNMGEVRLGQGRDAPSSTSATIRRRRTSWRQPSGRTSTS